MNALIEGPSISVEQRDSAVSELNGLDVKARQLREQVSRIDAEIKRRTAEHGISADYSLTERDSHVEEKAELSAQLDDVQAAMQVCRETLNAYAAQGASVDFMNAIERADSAAAKHVAVRKRAAVALGEFLDALAPLYKPEDEHLSARDECLRARQRIIAANGDAPQMPKSLPFGVADLLGMLRTELGKPPATRVTGADVRKSFHG